MHTPPAPPRYPIAAVERETGLSKDTLRMWERRYGFPLPERDSKGERSYSGEDVARLRHLRRLVQTGHRPGAVVPLDEPALALLLAALPHANAQAGLPTRPAAPVGNASAAVAVAPATGFSADGGGVAAGVVANCMRCIAQHDAAGLREQISRAVLGMGLEACVLHLVAPLTQQVGEAWAEGRFAVYEEHFYTECVTGVLRAAIASVPRPDESAACLRVLLTTTPREQHALGLLMLEAVLALRGCACLPLGTEMPIADIARAAQLFRSDIVALSFSGMLPAHRVRADLAELRGQLPPATQIWAGGQGAPARRSAVAGVTVLKRLDDVAAALAQHAAVQRPG